MDLVERDSQLRALQESLRQVAGGTGHAVLVSGEAGIGKTSLLQALAQRRGDALLWWGACDALQTPHPLAPLQDIARHADVGFRPQLLAGADRIELFEAVLAELQRSRRPVLAVIEDVHWADDATFDLLRFLARRIERTPCLLVVSYRDDQLPTAHPLRRLLGDLTGPRVTRIDVPRLSPGAVERLARSALRSPAGLHEATRGNPFFVTEVLRHDGNAVPRAVQDVVLARLAHLQPDAQAVVRLASIVPSRIERWLVEHLLGAASAPVEACLDSGLLTAVDATTLCFRHELARVAIESSISAPAARALHVAVLDVLHSQKADVSLARLVHHATRADDRDAILRHAPEAALQAERRGAHREAAAHYRSVLRAWGDAPHGADAPPAGWLEAYARECQLTDQLDEAIATRLRLVALHRRAGDVEGEAATLSQLALAYVPALMNSEADQASRAAIALLESRPAGRPLAHAFRVEAQLRMLSRDCDESIRWSRKAIALAERLGDAESLADATCTLGGATMFTDYAAGTAHLRHALEIAQAHGLDYIAANALSSLGAVSGELLQLDAAERYMNQAIDFAAAHQFDIHRNYCVAWLAVCAMYAGRWSDTAQRAQEIVAQSITCSTSRVMALAALGRARARSGEPGAGEALDEALDLALASETLQHIAPVRAARAEAAWLKGDLRAVREEAGAAFDMALRHRHAWFIGELAWWLRCADTRTAVPAPCAEPFAQQLRGEWAAAARAWEALGCRYEQARALSEGDPAAQLEALRLFERIGARPAADALRGRLKEAGQSLPRGMRASTQSNPYGLTAREVEVLGLLCQGLKNAAIAERLVRSVRTVDHHLTAAYAKLGVASRTEAVAAALQAGIGTAVWATGPGNLGESAVAMEGLAV